MPPNCFTLTSSPATIRRLIREADLVVGSVLIPGAKAPKLVTRDMLKTMKKGAVLVDVAIDQGGCFETSKPTTHKDPVYTVDGVIHYCVANMPGALAKTSTLALTNATLPYAVEIADKGWKKAMRENLEIREGRQRRQGQGHLQGGRRRLRPEIHAYRYTPLIISLPQRGNRSVPIALSLRLSLLHLLLRFIHHPGITPGSRRGTEERSSSRPHHLHQQGNADAPGAVQQQRRHKISRFPSAGNRQPLQGKHDEPGNDTREDRPEEQCREPVFRRPLLAGSPSTAGSPRPRPKMRARRPAVSRTAPSGRTNRELAVWCRRHGGWR